MTGNQELRLRVFVTKHNTLSFIGAERGARTTKNLSENIGWGQRLVDLESHTFKFR